MSRFVVFVPVEIAGKLQCERAENPEIDNCVRNAVNVGRIRQSLHHFLYDLRIDCRRKRVLSVKRVLHSVGERIKHPVKHIAAVNIHKDTDLAALLDYSEQEYDPAFVNAELLEYLESRLSSGTDLLPEVQPDVPASEAPAAETPVSSVMADGAYYAEFQSWTDAAATAELLVLTGASEASGNPSFSHTGEVLTFDTAGVDIYLEDIWNNGVEIHCQSVREAANTPVFGGDLTLAEASPMWAVLTVRGGAVTSVEFFYVA